jgi:tetratricopeptide (TPR) repeat protein
MMRMNSQLSQLSRLLGIVFFLVTALTLTSCGLSPSSTEDTDSTLASWEKYQVKLTEEERIELIRERRKELDSIRKWDFYTLRNNPEEALIYYLQVAEKLPDDVILQKKIGHAYFLKKDWKNAYAAYIKAPIGELTESEQGELLTSLFFDESQFDRIGELSRISTGTGKQEYYRVVDACYTGIHNCIVTIEAYSGEVVELSQLNNSIDDAEKISPDYQYRNFVVATKLYEYGEYRAASLVAREILTNRADYSAVEKLLWFSLYEIGNYTEARKYLLAYLEKTPKDIETIVRLGDIVFVQADFLTANLYYNNAILAGYPRKIDIERKLAYSYSRLGDTPSMMKVLAYILEEPEATVDDAAVAISLALQSGENLKAYVWSSNAIKKYREAPSIIALHLTAMRMIGKMDDAELYLSSIWDTLSDEPIILLEKAIILLEKDWNLSESLSLFEQVVASDPSADYALEAQNYIDFIQAKQLISNTWTVDGDTSSDTPWWQ